jgi:hypothetical protein
VAPPWPRVSPCVFLIPPLSGLSRSSRPGPGGDFARSSHCLRRLIRTGSPPPPHLVRTGSPPHCSAPLHLIRTGSPPPPGHHSPSSSVCFYERLAAPGGARFLSSQLHPAPVRRGKLDLASLAVRGRTRSRSKLLFSALSGGNGL